MINPKKIAPGNGVGGDGKKPLGRKLPGVNYQE